MTCARHGVLSKTLVLIVGRILVPKHKFENVLSRGVGPLARRACLGEPRRREILIDRIRNIDGIWNTLVLPSFKVPNVQHQWIPQRIGDFDTLIVHTCLHLDMSELFTRCSFCNFGYFAIADSGVSTPTRKIQLSNASETKAFTVIQPEPH